MLRVSVESFAYELQNDLPRLIQEYPNGIYFNALQDEYGESVLRIQKATAILESRHILKVHQAASKAMYIIPFEYKAPEPLIELTSLQRRLAIALVKIVRDAPTTTNLIRTSYSQLARIANCSYGGCLTVINRLVELDYLNIEQHSRAGHQEQLILRVTKQLRDRVDPYLDS